VRFWDPSAIVPLLVEEARSGEMRALIAADPGMVTWWGAAVECVGAAARLRREEVLTMAEEEAVLGRLDELADGWAEVLPSAQVRSGARRLLRLHVLRAADALQLAAARVWAGPTIHAEFVTFDERLALAARMEGFRVLPQA